MAKYCLKKVSKRMTCKKKFKIAKKVREHNRKLRKEEKLKLKQQKHRRAQPKLISIPNKCPFKEELLAEAEARRAQIEEEKAAKKAPKGKKPELTHQEEGKKGKKEEQRRLELVRELAGVDPSHYVIEPSDLMDSEECDRGADGARERGDGASKGGIATKTKQSRPARAFAGEVRKIVESADVVIEVLDARDPLGSRSAHIESLVIGSGKRLLLLLNKIDLVPKDVVLRWLTHLRRELPTIAFKASTQEQRSLGHYRPRGRGGVSGMKQLDAEKLSARCMGAELVMRALGNYCRNTGVKTSISVGIVGFPNVGKSSVINSLKRKRICATGAVPGLTRTIQEVQLDAHIRLLDSPGVVLASECQGGGTDPAELALKNALKVETLADPIAPVQALLKRCSVKVLMLHYSIPQFASTDEFLSLVARKMGRLKKGGVPNQTAAARSVLNDWNKGKLRYYVEPPTQPKSSTGVDALGESESQLVSSFAKEFDLDALDGEIRTLVEEFPSAEMQVDTATPYDPTIPNAMELKTNSCSSSSGPKTIVMASKKAIAGMDSAGKKRVRFAADDGLPPPEKLDVAGGNAQLNKLLRGVMKKRRKVKRRVEKESGELADSLAGMSSLNAEAMMDVEGEEE